MAGIFNSNSYSNNKQDAGNFAIYGNLNGFGYRASSNSRKAGKITTPNGTLRNTGMIEKIKVRPLVWTGIGVIFIWILLKGTNPRSFRQSKRKSWSYCLSKTSSREISFSFVFIFSAGNLELDFSYQRNNRREIESKNKLLPIQDILLDKNAEVLDKSFQFYQVTSKEKYQGLNLFLDTTTADAKFHHKPIFNFLKGTIGISGLEQRNKTIGTEPLIPSYGIINIAGYFLEELKLGSLTFSAGIRGDKRSVDIRNNQTLGVSEQTKNYYMTTGSTGVVWKDL
ncbi:hypothetical protein LEP1GSC151_0172 [Leptospira interrogans serovar Grippotyphosa str. LT2186]|uniref:Uncharacterized protein n=1 Tax=Leptospira interrogans serovar Grippotyphosa str. LT2186 TaxID=1001599 RepID=M3FP60_LEPIR|nr:hypothetical protein LEP1GSC151_0172 [Leptospira interrogans serovar Grippotyphosa str. LT2186]